MPLEDQVSSTKSRQPGLENESPVLPCDPWRGGGGGWFTREGTHAHANLCAARQRAHNTVKPLSFD